MPFINPTRFTMATLVSANGGVHESVWNDSLTSEACVWSELLRETVPTEQLCENDASLEEVGGALNRLKLGRSPGANGILTEVLKGLPCTLLFVTSLFNLVFRRAVYPTQFGLGLIHSILKPRKPPDQPSSLRGIRLLSRLTAWLGQVLDGRFRIRRMNGPEQLGFQQGAGCMAAMFVLLTLIKSRNQSRKHLYVLWVDLRTAFPSINRALLLRRLFLCRVCAGFCKIVQAMFDLTVSLVYLSRLLGLSFLGKLGVREGAVESPYQFNGFMAPLRAYLEARHPSLCSLAQITIAVILFADDAALPADSSADLVLLASLFEQFCHDNHLYISTNNSYITVFHSECDDRVRYSKGKCSSGSARWLLPSMGSRSQLRMC